MRYMKAAMFVAASLVLTVVLGFTGCGDGHKDHVRTEPDRSERSDRHDNDRHDNDRHDDHGADHSHDRYEHGHR